MRPSSRSLGAPPPPAAVTAYPKLLISQPAATFLTKGCNVALAGELGDIGVQIHPIGTIQFHYDVFLLELGEPVGYFHGEFQLGICSPVKWSNRRLSSIFRRLRAPRRPAGLILYL